MALSYQQVWLNYALLYECDFCPISLLPELCCLQHGTLYQLHRFWWNLHHLNTVIFGKMMSTASQISASSLCNYSKTHFNCVMWQVTPVAQRGRPSGMKFRMHTFKTKTVLLGQPELNFLLHTFIKTSYSSQT